MNFTTPANTRLHWNYFLALEKDLEAVSRYVEFCPDNFNTYSIALAHILLSAASEIDTVAKCICTILDPAAKTPNIDAYRSIIKTGEDTEQNALMLLNAHTNADPETYKHRISKLKVYIPRYSLEFIPWESLANDKNPDWWRSYNDVKHERNQYFNKATLKNAIHAVGGLLAINYLYCRLEITKDKPAVRYQYREKNVILKSGHKNQSKECCRF